MPYTPLNCLLDSVTEHVDFLSLDVEGAELSVLDGFDLHKYCPRVLIIESNTAEHRNELEMN